jgi:hypothetical protein
VNIPSSQRFLVAYSATVTVAFALVVLCGFASHKDKVSFDEIDVHRINVVEPDGTLRMVIANQDSSPGGMVKGKEYPHPNRKAAGILFYDNEGTEAGGLIYGSSLDENGKLKGANIHLSFDQYMQDQVFSVDAEQSVGDKVTALRISDRGDYSILDAIQASERIAKLPQDQHEAAWREFSATHPGDHPRIVLGRVADRSAVLQLKDTEGRNRIVLKVAPDGAPSIQLLDAEGKVAKEIGVTSQP